MIKYLKYHEIDKAKWDNCIRQSEHFRLFALSWYLDIVNPNWHGLVLDDYKAVFPLPHKKKYGLPVLLQPVFTQQLGLFSNSDEVNLKAFLSKIPLKYVYTKLKFWHSIPAGNAYRQIERTNYILPLAKDIEWLREQYTKSHRKNIRKANVRGVQVADSELDESINFLAEQYFEILGTAKWYFNILSKFLKKGQEYGELKCLKAFYHDEMLATMCCLKVDRHIFTIMVASDEGKEKRALFKVVDEMISYFSGSDACLDFGGSDVENIAYFFSSFGSQKEHYYQVSSSILTRLNPF